MMTGRERRVRLDARYEVSSEGIVYSGGLPLTAVGGEVRLHGERRKVAYLVARAFVPNVEGRQWVRHKNGDRGDDRAENLEWSDEKEVVRRGRKPGVRWIGAWNADGEKVGEWRNVSEASMALGVSERKVRDAARRGGKAGGYRWLWL